MCWSFIFVLRTVLFESGVQPVVTADCWRCYDCETPHTRGVAMRGELGLHAVLIIQIVYQALSHQPVRMRCSAIGLHMERGCEVLRFAIIAVGSRTWRM